MLIHCTTFYVKNPPLFSFTISEFIYFSKHEIIFTNSERGLAMHFESDTSLYHVIGANIDNTINIDIINFFKESTHNDIQ